MKIEMQNDSNRRNDYKTNKKKNSDVGNNIFWNKNALKFQEKLYETSINKKSDIFKNPLNPYDSFTEDFEEGEVTLHKLSDKINKDFNKTPQDISNFGVWSIEWIENKNQRDANAKIITKFRDDLSGEEYKSLCLRIMPFCKKKKRTLDFISREILESDPEEERDKVNELFNCISNELDSIDRPDLKKNPKIMCRIYWLKRMEENGLNVKRCGLFGKSECF